MAGSFADAFNKALSKITGRAVEGKTPRIRPKSSNKGLFGAIGTWQKSRQIMEKTKGRISRIEPLEAVRGKVKQDEQIAGYPNAPKKKTLMDRARGIIERIKVALGLDEKRKLTRQAEFDMVLDDDPAFAAWVNRVGAEGGATAEPGKTLTQSRLDWLCKLFGVEDALALYDYVTNDPDFGYEQFQAAYADDGKNHQNRWNPAYRLDDKISMHMAQVSLFKQFPIYSLITA